MNTIMAQSSYQVCSQTPTCIVFNRLTVKGSQIITITVKTPELQSEAVPISNKALLSDTFHQHLQIQSQGRVSLEMTNPLRVSSGLTSLWFESSAMKAIRPDAH